MFCLFLKPHTLISTKIHQCISLLCEVKWHKCSKTLEENSYGNYFNNHFFFFKSDLLQEQAVKRFKKDLEAYLSFRYF